MSHHKKTAYAKKGQALAAASRSARTSGLAMRVYWCKEHKAYEITKRVAPRTRSNPDSPPGNR